MDVVWVVILSIVVVLVFFVVVLLVVVLSLLVWGGLELGECCLSFTWCSIVP